MPDLADLSQREEPRHLAHHPIEERAIKERAHQDRRESRAWIAIGRYGGDRQERGTGRDECPWRDAPREHGERGKEQTGNGNREPCVQQEKSIGECAILGPDRRQLE